MINQLFHFGGPFERLQPSLVANIGRYSLECKAYGWRNTKLRHEGQDGICFSTLLARSPSSTLALFLGSSSLVPLSVTW